MPMPRVLVVEDDAAVQTFVARALGGLNVRIDAVRSVADAEARFTAQNYPVVIADITLSDGSALPLIRQWLAPVTGESQTKVIVFSGGLHSQVRDALTALGVYRCVNKPSSARELSEAVRDALDLVNWPDAPGEESGVVADDLEPFELAAIEEYFDGDRDFYQVFRASCVEQFKVDLSEGDDAVLVGDAPRLRRTAHSLKSVLRTLGYGDHSLQAKQVEDASHQRPWPEAVEGWNELRQRIVRSFGLAI